MSEAHAPRPASAAERAVFFPNLDGLRFLSFLAVFFVHVFDNDERLRIASASRAYWWSHAILSLNSFAGEAGVAFFFVLSGFLITYLMLDEHQKTGGFSIKRFYIRRTLRIWPLYYGVVLFAFFVVPFVARALHYHLAKETASAPAFLLFLANFDVIAHGSPVNPTIGVQWSVAVEEQFYIVWPLLFWWFGVRGNRRRHAAVCAAVVVVALVFRAAHRDDADVLHSHTLSVMGDLAIGALAAHLAFARRIRLIERLPRGAIIAVYVAAVVTIDRSGHIFVGWLQPLQRIVHAAFFAFVILEQNYARNSAYKTSQFAVVTKLGRYTYGLYSLHMFGIVAAGLITKQPTMTGLLLRTLLAATITLVASMLSYHVFESYFLRLKDRFSPLRQSESEPTERAKAEAVAVE